LPLQAVELRRVQEPRGERLPHALDGGVDRGSTKIVLGAIAHPGLDMAVLQPPRGRA
jgi:hypothetical protein